MDYDQALRIACFYGMVVDVEKLLWMEAEPSSVAFNHRDRGSAFHTSVNSAVRDGVNALLNESSAGAIDGNGADGTSSTVALAKEAAAAWEAAAACASPTGTLRSSTSTGTGWTSGGESSSRGGDGGGYQSSSVASEREDGRRAGGGDGHENCSARVRQALGFLGRDREDERKEDYDSNDDDDDTESFILPSLVSLENDLIREGHAGIFGVETSVSTRAAAAVRKWGQRVTGGGGGGRMAGGGSGGRGWDRKESAANVSKGAGLGVVKDRAKATFAGVIKWATSPKGRRTESFAG